MFRPNPRTSASAALLTAVALSSGMGPGLTACSDDAGPSDTTDTADTSPSGRSFLLAARAEDYDPTRARPFVPSFEGLTFQNEDNTAERLVEAIVLPIDLLGIPWTSFNGPDNRPGSLPATWLAELDAMVLAATNQGLPIVVTVSPLADTHDTLSPLASDGGSELVLNPTWKPSCYNPATDSNPTLHRDQFAGFVVWLAERLEPAAIVIGQRINLYEANCGAAPFQAIKGFVSHAHDRLQASTTLVSKPLTITTFDVEDLYGFPARAGRCVSTSPKDCLITRAPLMADLGVDRLGLESHPARAFSDLDDVPSDWLAAIAASQPAPALPAMVAATGVPASRLDADRGACAPFVESNENAQRLWLDQVIGFSEAQDAPFLVWRTLIDPLPTALVTGCPCVGDVALCTHLEGLGNRRDDRRALLASGLIDYDGKPRSALSLWRGLLAP